MSDAELDGLREDLRCAIRDAVNAERRARLAYAEAAQARARLDTVAAETLRAAAADLLAGPNYRERRRSMVRWLQARADKLDPPPNPV